MTQVCLSCGADNRDTAKFCKACGTALLPPAEVRPFESSAWPAPDVVAAAAPTTPLSDAAPGDPFTATQFHAHRWAGDPPSAPSVELMAEPATTPPSATAFYAPAEPEPEPWFLPGGTGALAAPLAAGVPLPRPFGLPASVGKGGAAPVSTPLLGGLKAPAAAMDASGVGGGGVAAATTAAHWPGVAAAAAVALVVVALVAWVVWGWGAFGDKAEPRPAATVVKKSVPPVAEVAPGALVAAAPTAAGALSPPPSPASSKVDDVSAPPALPPTAPAPAGGARVVAPTAVPEPTTPPALPRPSSDARLAAAKPAARINLGGSASPAAQTATRAAEPAAAAPPSPTPVMPVVVLPSGPASPQEACTAAGMFRRSTCLNEQCAKPVFATHSQCRRWRLERQQEEEQQRLYGGS